MEEKIRRTSHLPKWKREEIKEIKNEIKNHSTLAIVDMHGIPADQMQKIRSELRGLVKLKVARNSLISIALNECNGEIKKLDSYIKGQTGLIFTDINPFKLNKLLEKTKTPAPAKPGDIAPRDIFIEKGATSLKPGPVLSELQALGISAGVEGGKVVIRNRAVVAKAGEAISPKLADILRNLEIFPMEIGLNLRAAYSDNLIFTPEMLAIDETKYSAEITKAVQQAYNLAMNIAYPSKLIIIPLLQKAAIEARNLGINAAIFEKAIIEELLLKGYSQMLALTSAVSNIDIKAIDEELKAKIAVKNEVEKAVKIEAHEKIEEKEKRREREKEKEEENGAAGLGALFG
ncbi:MAG: 50S ribosomal protein L10 [Methanocellales archaeon]